MARKLRRKHEHFKRKATEQEAKKIDEGRKWSYMLNGKQDLQAKREENVRKKGVVKVVNCHRELS